jgi:alkylhydroperoxidase family enzyme
MTEHSSKPSDREPRIARLNAEDAMRSDPSLRESFQRFIDERGKVPNLFRIAAHRPDITRTLTDHMRAVMEAGDVSRLLKELLSVRVSQINNCEY